MGDEPPFIKEISNGIIDMPMQAIALFGAMILFVPGIEVISWRQAQSDVDWGGIVLICAGISLGMVIYHTGAARWLSWILLSPIVQLPDVLRVFAIVLGVSLLHVAFSSNTVTGTIIIPLLIALASDLHINPWLICAPAVFYLFPRLYFGYGDTNQCDPVFCRVFFYWRHGEDRHCHDLCRCSVPGDFDPCVRKPHRYIFNYVS